MFIFGMGVIGSLLKRNNEENPEYLDESSDYLSTTNESDDSSVFSDSTSEDEILERYKSRSLLSINTMKAIDNNQIDSLPSQKLNPNKITLEDVREIDKQLELYEKISLLYLLIDDCQPCHQNITSLLHDSCQNVMTNWAEQAQENDKNWKSKLIEAITIIQNYQILKKFQFDKNELRIKYTPQHGFVVVHLNKFRKNLYLLSEKFDMKQTEKFLDSVENDFKKMQLEFIRYNQEYLECYLIHWESINYINNQDIRKITKILKSMDLIEWADELMKIVKTTNPRQSMGIDYNAAHLSGQKPEITTRIPRDNNARYDINSNNPGVCLIINQQNFYREFDKKYQHLLPQTDERFETRLGSEKDAEILEETFRQRGFRILSRENLDHLKLMEIINCTIDEIEEESSLIICILSHGNEGIIYGANSCKIDIRDIQSSLTKKNRKNLQGKPKIMILQACQGGKCQKLPQIDVHSDSDDNETDNVPNYSKHTVPSTADVLQFYATVPGYSAIRNKKTGSWFIQSLCKKITDCADETHFEDICTKVIDDVSSQTWRREHDEFVMVPLKSSSLRKYFYLPKLQ